MEEFSNKLVENKDLEKYIGRGWFVVEKKKGVYLMARKNVDYISELQRSLREMSEDFPQGGGKTLPNVEPKV